jgi:probable addiction module antidote protein
MAVKIKLSRWDSAEHIATPEHVAAYLKAAFDDGDPQVIAAMVGAVARSHGMR